MSYSSYLLLDRWLQDLQPGPGRDRVGGGAVQQRPDHRDEAQDLGQGVRSRHRVSLQWKVFAGLQPKR